MSVLWSVYLAVTLVSHTLCTLSPENEVPLRTTTWLSDGKNTPVHLRKGHTHRLHFTLRKKTTALMLTVSPCSGSVEWSLTAHTLKDKPAKDRYWSFKKSEPEVWWRKSASEKTLHTYSGSAVDTYEGPVLHPVSVYTLRIKSTQEDMHAYVYLHEGPAPWGVFPELPLDPRVHMLGVGMSSVTLTWNPSSSVIKALHTHKHARPYEYCVTVNRKHNYRSVCAAQEGKGGMKDEWKKKAVVKLDRSDDHVCVCEEVESVCTISELLPNTLYYFDVFVIDRMNGTSAAYTGTVARTHAEPYAHAEPQTHTEPYTHRVTPLKEGQVLWVTLSSGADQRRSFRFRPRGGQKNGLLTLLSCNNTHTLSVSVSARGHELTSQEVGDQLIQMWLQGFSSYLIQLRLSTRNTHAAERESLCVKMQASSAFHRRGAPALPHTLHIKSFNTLRTCNSVTLAWMGTEERGLYCLYRRRADEQSETGGQKSETGRDRVIWGGQRSMHGRDRVVWGRQRSEPGRDGVMQGGQRSESGRDGVMQGGQRSESGRDGVMQGGQRSEPGRDGVMQGGQRSESGRDGVMQGGQRSEPGRDGVIWGGQRSMHGRDRVVWGRQRSEPGRDGMMQGGQRCETGRSRKVWDRQRSETDQDAVICSEQKSETGRNRVIPREHRSDTDRCLAPESRPPDQRVLCKYFQELDARRAVTTATVGGLEAETLYTFDIYLMRRWALPVKYHSKTVRTRRDC